jgi:exodeoxyribonuclease VII small subunit
MTGPSDPDVGSEPPQDPAEMSFEAVLEELEATVEHLEGGALTLEQQVAFYERGMRLVKACREKLEAAAARIEKVVSTEEGETVVEPLEQGDQDS